MGPRTLSAACLSLALAASCGGSAGGGGPSAGRLSLTLGGPSTWSAKSTVVERIEPTALPERWTFQTDEEMDKNPVLEQMAEDGQAVVLAGRGSRSRAFAIVRQRIDPSRFNQIQVHHVVDGQTSLKVVLRRPGEDGWTSLQVPVAGDTEVRRTTIQVPRTVREGGDLREMRLIYAGGIRRIGLLAVEFVDEPAEGLLPDPSQGPALIRIGDEWREGSGLTPRHALETSFRVGRGTRLAFSAGEVLETFDEGREVILSVTLSGRGGEVERSFPLDAAWGTHTIDTAGLKPGPAIARFSVSAGGALDAACAVSTPQLLGDAPAPERPSVLLITSDTHRGDYIGVAGDTEFIDTPVLDQLAAEGVYFDQCFVLSNVTNPSHSCLLTGLDPTRTRISSNNQLVSESALTLAEAFRAEGYTTWAALGVRHLVGDVSGLDQGFDRMAGPIDKDRAAPHTLDIAERWLSEERAEPLFLWVHFYDAHWPYTPEPEYAELYEDEIDREREPFEWDHKLVSTRGEIENLDVPRAHYKAEVTYLDEQLGRIIGHDAFRDGIVSLVGDHGEALGEHEIYFTHAELYPDVLHVPMLLRWPEAPKGTRISGITSQLDLGRTLLDLAGLADTEFPGKGLLRHIEAGRAEGDTHFALAGSNTSASVTREGMHLILHLKRHRSAYSVNRKEPHVTELYDLRADPTCENDLIDERPELAAELRALVIRWLENADPEGLLGGGVNDPELERQLADLGYVDLGDSTTEPLWTPDECEWCARFDL